MIPASFVSTNDEANMCFRSVERIKERTDVPAFSLGFMAQLLTRTRQDLSCKEHGESLHEAMSRAFISGVNFAALFPHVRDAPARKTIRYAAPAPPPRQVDYRVIVPPDALVEFVFCLAIHGPGENGQLMILFAERLTSQADALSAESLNILWVPFLYRLLPAMLKRGISLESPYYQTLYSTLLAAYATKYVGREPAKDHNLIRRQVACKCNDCTPLNRFLVNPEEETQSFTVNKQRRAHMHQKLDAARIDCTHLTNHWGSTHTMVVTKTFPANEAARQQWKDRRAEAHALLKAFNPPGLVALLGQEQYEQALYMNGLAVAGTAPLGQVSGNRQTGGFQRFQTGARPRQVSGVKRTHAEAERDVIDLISD
jgi:hypothetical protein